MRPMMKVPALTLGFWLLLGCTDRTDGGPLPNAGEPSACQASLLPEKIGKVAPGMTAGDLRKARPILKADDFPGTYASGDWLSEDLAGDPFFDHVSYQIVGNTVRTIKLGGSWSREVIEERRGEFLRLLRSRCGDPEDLHVRKLRRRGEFQIPAVAWKEGSTAVVASFPPSRAPGGGPYDPDREPFAPYFFEFVISSLEPEELKKSLGLAAVPESPGTDQDSLFKDLADAGFSLPAAGR
jgi:hypothetical protein